MNQIAEVLKDAPVREEMHEIVRSGGNLPKGEQWSVTPAMVDRVLSARQPAPTEGTTRPFTEAVIRQFARPVLLIRNNKIELPRSREIRNRLLPAKARLEARVPSVGRLEFVGHPDLRWGGTGWLISERTIVTNRHVAELFAQPRGRGFVFRANPVSGEAMQARIDFREEYHPAPAPEASFEVPVRRITFVERDDTSRRKLPDIAFLELEGVSGLAAPIPLAEDALEDDADIAVVGYPARDPRGTPSETAAHRIFGDIYEVKRLSPGKVLIADPQNWFFTHDATTLGGNSGSVVLDLATGGAVGLHFMGELEQANFAVNPKTLLDYVAKLKLRSLITTPGDVATPSPAEAITESAPEDYADRMGFDPAFLGAGARVELPSKKTKPRDVLTFTFGGKRTSELKYMHFSLAMSKKRKLCLWSVVNIDGKVTRKATRTSWRIDGRIPGDSQTTGDPHDPDKDVYGNEPRFARGHMTRREDPIWGPEADALLGNDDSMHLTNVVPQMQPFNAGIWNNLEDYALLNARKDQMRISVMTGPVLGDDDPIRFQTQIPVEFWKVIAFIHDDTGKLTATGYLMSQASFLEPEEFVFGGFDTYQLPIASIEKKTGLSFGTLGRADPLKGADEAAVPRLTDLAQIRFLREG